MVFVFHIDFCVYRCKSSKKYKRVFQEEKMLEHSSITLHLLLYLDIFCCSLEIYKIFVALLVSKCLNVEARCVRWSCAPARNEIFGSHCLSQLEGFAFRRSSRIQSLVSITTALVQRLLSCSFI